MNTVQLVQQNLNPELKVKEVLLTMYDSRTRIVGTGGRRSPDIFKEQAYHTMIPRTVRLSEAPSYGMPIIAYDGGSRGAEVYMQLAKEVLSRE